MKERISEILVRRDFDFTLKNPEPFSLYKEGDFLKNDLIMFVQGYDVSEKNTISKIKFFLGNTLIVKDQPEMFLEAHWKFKSCVTTLPNVYLTIDNLFRSWKQERLCYNCRKIRTISSNASRLGQSLCVLCVWCMGGRCEHFWFQNRSLSNVFLTFREFYNVPADLDFCKK